MSKILKHIDVELTKSSLNRAIREIRSFRDELTRSMNDLMQKLVDEGISVARIQIASMDAVDTGALEHSIAGYFDPQTRIGYVYSGSMYAIYVEYGTGPIGAESPHPAPETANWEYAIGEHIKPGPGGLGWWYMKGSDDTFSEEGGEYRWTRGQPSRPFMFNTLEWLEEAAETIASTVWNQM